MSKAGRKSTFYLLLSVLEVLAYFCHTLRRDGKKRVDEEQGKWFSTVLSRLGTPAVCEAEALTLETASWGPADMATNPIG